MYMDGRSRVAFIVEIMQFCLMNSRQTRRYFNLYNVILIGPYITGKFNVYYFSMFICNAFFLRHNFSFVFNVPSYLFFLSHSDNKNDVHVVIWPSNNFQTCHIKEYIQVHGTLHTYIHTYVSTIRFELNSCDRLLFFYCLLLSIGCHNKIPA